MDNERSDEDLMLGYRAGDAGAFEVLYRRHRGALYRYLLRQCGHQSTADELFQDVWMKLIQARERYQVKARFRTYLYHMAHNRLVDHYRRNSNRPVPDGTGNMETIDQLAAGDCDQPEHQVQVQQQLSRLMGSIQRLPDEQREAFLLRMEAGLDVGDIANVTGVGQETAKSRLRYALQRLRKEMGEST